MWNPNIRPYGECFALNQAITTAAVAGNQTANNPMRMDQAQGGSAIRVVVPREADKSLTVAAAATVTLNVMGGTTATATPVMLGTAVFTNDTGAALTLGPDSLVCEFILPQNLLKYPYIRVQILGSAAPTGSVDIYPHHVSHPRR